MTYPMPGPPSNEECTCYERVIPADDPCGTPEGSIESVTPVSCPFHSWTVKHTIKEKTLTDEGCWAFYYHELSERFREDADPDLSKSVVWNRFANHPHAFEVRYIL